MKNPFQRIAALALCFTLTLGAFAYRPPKAEAVVGVDDAVVIGALLSAFAGGCGLIFSNNGMTSSELAQGLTDKWNQFKAAVLEVDTTFAGWLGYEDMDALLQAIVLSGGSALTLPRIVAHKFAEFTTWLTDNLGVPAGGDSVPVASVSVPKYYRMAYDSDLGYLIDTEITYTLSTYVDSSHYSLGTPIFNLYDLPTTEDDALIFGTPRGAAIGLCVFYAYRDDSCAHFKSKASSYPSYNNVELGKTMVDGNVYLFMRRYDSNDDGLAWGFEYYDFSNGVRVKRFKEVGNTCVRFAKSQVAQNDLSVFAPSYYKNPTIDLPAEGEEAANPTLSGVGDGTATTIEGLLQQILAQLQANTLAPTLDLAGTETGGNTGADEDAKPYLPYIPQIFEKIKELPGTLANIWETVKGIPAAIAEKIGAFFTTLWGWLQNIIDAITALPAAIAEKIGALFKPDEALLTEITDTFKGKFGFFSTLKQFGSDLFGMTPETEPPVIWVHLENAESKFGYNYGDKQKIFDMTWYQKYKASVDGLLSGFLWLGYLWLLFKRAPSILNGMQMDEDLRPPLLVGDVSSAPRLGAGDPSIHYGEGFTFRSKGGRRK